jgi:hypothetical protein
VVAGSFPRKFRYLWPSALPPQGNIRLKKLNEILFRGLFFIVAIQVLNLSICGDYTTTRDSVVRVNVHYDDINSFAEFVLEKIAGDRTSASENDEDDDNPVENDLEKYETGPLYFEHIPHHQVVYTINQGSAWATGIDMANKICKGHFSIISPPPKFS